MVTHTHLVPKPAAMKASAKPKLGLRAWMEQVLVECDHAAAGFDVDAVHDLRVALRRCRSLADGMMAIDPEPSWKAMKKAGKKVFQALGDLRDMQVMEEWIEKLDGAKSAVKTGLNSDSDDPVTAKLLDFVHAREAECKQEAFKDLQLFDRREWRSWCRTLPARAARVRPGSAVYLHLALEKWMDAYELHKHALRARSKVGWHELRIGIKRFRYTVENFLPRQHQAWGDDLKELQDLLGDVHDLDVLWSLAIRSDVAAFPDAESRARWRETVSAERSRRIARYRQKMVGRESLWRMWRAELPEGSQLRAAALSRLRVWAGYLDPDFAHSQRVARLALLLYDGLAQAGLMRVASPHAGANDAASSQPGYDARAVLHAAALMHDVGKAKREQNHHKRSYRMIRSLQPPLGWSARELEMAALVARYHRGALPRPRAKAMQTLDLRERAMVIELAGVLRLANSLNLVHHEAVHREVAYREGRDELGTAKAPRLEVHLNARQGLRPQDSFVEVRMAGYSALERSAEQVAAARHVLETALRRPLLVRGLRIARRSKPGLALVGKS